MGKKKLYWKKKFRELRKYSKQRIKVEIFYNRFSYGLFFLQTWNTQTKHKHNLNISSYNILRVTPNYLNPKAEIGRAQNFYPHVGSI